MELKEPEKIMNEACKLAIIMKTLKEGNISIEQAVNILKEQLTIIKIEEKEDDY